MNSYFWEQTEHVSCHSFEFLHNIFYQFHLRIQYRQRHIQGTIKDLRCSFWRQQLTVPEAYSEPSRTSKMKLFEKNFFQPFTIYTQSSISDLPLSCEYTSGTINYFAIGSILMLDWVLDTSLTCLKKYKNCEKPVKQFFLETLQQRLINNS